MVAALTHVMEKHHDILPADDVPFADAGRDIGDGQRLTLDLAFWEWLLKKAVFCLTGAVIVSIDPDRQVRIEGGELVSPEVARQDWLERAGACIVASLACLIKWKEALDKGCPTRELGEEEERQQQQVSAHYYELLHQFRVLRFKDDVLLFIEAAVAQYAKRWRG